MVVFMATRFVPYRVAVQGRDDAGGHESGPFRPLRRGGLPRLAIHAYRRVWHPVLEYQVELICQVGVDHRVEDEVGVVDGAFDQREALGAFDLDRTAP
jgi:hypothetical protein